MFNLPPCTPVKQVIAENFNAKNRKIKMEHKYPVSIFIGKRISTIQSHIPFRIFCSKWNLKSKKVTFLSRAKHGW